VRISLGFSDATLLPI